MTASNDVLSNIANFTPPTQASLFYAAKQRWQLLTLWTAEFLSECCHALMPNASPWILSRMGLFLTQCSTIVCAYR